MMGNKATATERLYVPLNIDNGSNPGPRVLFAVPGDEYDEVEYARLTAAADEDVDGEGEGDAPPPSGDDDQVPDDWRDAIAWIGDDPERARRAADVEAARENPRKSVLDHIEEVTAADEDVDGEGEGADEEETS